MQNENLNQPCFDRVGFCPECNTFRPVAIVGTEKTDVYVRCQDGHNITYLIKKLDNAGNLNKIELWHG